MTIDASLLVLSILIFMAMIAVQSVFSNLEHPPKTMLGARDGMADKDTMTLRTKRANQNMIEALLIHVPLVLIAIMTERTNEMTALGGWVFVIGRATYAPIYWLGIPYLRTVAWFAGVVGSVLVLLQILPFTGAA